MEAVVLLHPGRGRAAVQTWVRQSGAQLLPMFPGAQDADGQRSYLLQCVDSSQLPALVAQLRGHADVEAAYIKPDGEPPSG